MVAVSANVVFALVLGIVGALIAGVLLVQSKFTALIAWSVLACAIAIILLTVKVLS